MATITRSEVRLRAARRIGDCIILTATATGSTTTLIDTDHLTVQNDHFIGREVCAISGTAANIVSGTGVVRRVSDSAESTGTITFGRAAPAATATGDVWHMFNYLNNGILINEWNGYIDEAIDAVRDTHVSEAISVAFAFDRDSPVVALNSTLDLAGTTDDGDDLWGVFGVDWKDDNAIWHPIKHQELRVDKASRTIELLGRGRENADGQSIRVRGYLQVALPTADTSTTTVDPEYIAAYAAGRALFTMKRRLPPGEAVIAGQEATVWLQLAEARKAATRTRIAPGTWKF